MHALAAQAAPPPPPLARQYINASALYDALYTSGYHKDLNASRAVDLLPFVLDIAKRYRSSSVLDIGCSHGWAVHQLWHHGLRASGVDVSGVAVALAKRARGEPTDSCVPPCFVRSSATTLPWANHSFDIVMSTDVLEHLEKKDVPLAVRELNRVARRALVLKISRVHDRLDGVQRASVTEQVGKDVKLPRDLHTTVQRPEYWYRSFQAVDPSWTLQANPAWMKHEKDPNRLHYYQQGRPWTCCSFALVRNPLSAVGRETESS